MALCVAFSRLRYSYQIEAGLRRAFEHAFGPVSFATSVDCGPVTLLIFYFDSTRLEHPVDAAEVRRLTEPLVTTGRTAWPSRSSASSASARVAACSAATSRPSRGAASTAR